MEWADLIREHAKDFLLVSHLFHQQAKRIINNELSSTGRRALAAGTRGLEPAQPRAEPREVADSLQISENTLRAYIDSARHKLGAMNVTHAVALALARGVIGQAGVLPKY